MGRQSTKDTEDPKDASKRESKYATLGKVKLQARRFIDNIEPLSRFDPRRGLPSVHRPDVQEGEGRQDDAHPRLENSRLRPWDTGPQKLRPSTYAMF